MALGRRLAGSPSPVQIARVGVFLAIPMGALGRLTPGGPKLPPTGGRVARAALSATIPQAFAHPLVHARAKKPAINPASAGAVLRVAAVARLARVAASNERELAKLLVDDRDGVL